MSIPVDLTMSIVAAMVSQVYPSVEVESVAPLAGGNINAVFEIACAKLPTKLVLKIYADTYHWKMEKEVFVYGLLADRPGVSAPTVLATDASKTLWPQNYTIMTKLDGVMLREAADAMSAEQLCSVRAYRPRFVIMTFTTPTSWSRAKQAVWWGFWT